MTTSLSLLASLEESGIEVSGSHASKSAWLHQSSWRNAFLDGGVTRTGCLEWELLEGCHVRVARGAQAAEKFSMMLQSIDPGSTLTLTERMGSPPTLEVCSTLQLVTFISQVWLGDLYVTDSRYTWTYVVTHERPWFGPYFVCRALET